MPQDTTQDRDAPGHAQLEHGMASLVEAALQYRQVAHVVGNFMGEHRHGGCCAQADVGHESRRHQNAVTKGMHAVACQYRPTACKTLCVLMSMLMVVVLMVMVRLVMVMLMAVVPQLGFVEQKEKHQADQQGGEQGLRRNVRFKSLGQQMHESRGQQSTCSQTEQMLREPTQERPGQQRCQQDTAHTRAQSACHCGPQGHAHLKPSLAA